MIRAIIVEDEEAARSLLSKILAKYCSDIELIGYAESVDEAVQFIFQTDPDLVFFDIEINGGSSFEILKTIENRRFKTIFTTAFNDHALKAFEYEAIHYILKPYQVLDVIEGVERVKKILKKEESFSDLMNVSSSSYKLDANKITLSTKEGIFLVEIDNIIRLEADRSYCNVYLNNNKRILLSKPLKNYVESLPKDQFFRSHNSHLINLNYVEKFIKEDGGEIIMSDGSSVPIARRRKAMFLEIL